MFFWVLLLVELPFGAAIIRFPVAVFYFWRSYLTNTTLISIVITSLYLTYASFNITNEILIVVAAIFGLLIFTQAKSILSHMSAVHVLITTFAIQVLQILHFFPWQSYFLLLPEIYSYRPTVFSSEPSFFAYIFFYLTLFLILSRRVNSLSAVFILLNALVIVSFGAALTLVSMATIALVAWIILYPASKIKHLIPIYVAAPMVVTFYISTFFGLEIGSRYYNWSFSEFILGQTLSWREFSTLQTFMGADIINWPRLGSWEEVYSIGSWSYSEYHWIDSQWSISAVFLAEFGIVPTLAIVIISWRIYYVRTDDVFENASQITLFLMAVLFGPKWGLFFFLNPLKLRPVQLIRR